MSPARYGCEIAFRLGPGHDEQARAVIRELVGRSEGSRGGVLFLNDAGEYGALIEWDRMTDAERYVDSPVVRRVLSQLGEQLGREPHIRIYRMERYGGEGSHESEGGL